MPLAPQTAPLTFPFPVVQGATDQHTDQVTNDDFPKDDQFDQGFNDHGQNDQVFNDQGPNEEMNEEAKPSPDFIENEGAPDFADDQGATDPDEDEGAFDVDEDEGAHEYNDGQGVPEAWYNLHSRTHPNSGAFRSAVDEPYNTKSYFPPRQFLQRHIRLCDDPGQFRPQVQNHPNANARSTGEKRRRL